MTFSTQIRLDDVREENETLRERIRQLETLLAPVVVLPPEWGLSRNETLIFRVLLGREMATKDQMMAILYGDRADEPPDPKILSVFIFKMRKKLKPFDINIRTFWGSGAGLDPDTRQRFRATAGRAA